MNPPAFPPPSTNASPPKRRLFFAGIGGIGMSALARHFHRLGHTVAGYDRTPTPLTRTLEAEGISVAYSPDAFQPANWDEAVYTPALAADNPILVAAQQAQLPMRKRAELLGALSRVQPTLAIAGTHGKTTTSSLLAHLLHQVGLGPTAFVGGVMANYGTNYLPGGALKASVGGVAPPSPLGEGGRGGEALPPLVAEADEFDRSFLQLSPTHALITTTEADHLDIYGTHQALLDAFRAFTDRISPGGKLLLHHSIAQQFTGCKALQTCRVDTYGAHFGTFRAQNIHTTERGLSFDFVTPNGTSNGWTMPMLGEHNLENAVGALGLALTQTDDLELLKSALSSFAGIKRRLELIVQTEQVAYFDDYAHHPTEIRAAIQAVRQRFPDRKLVVCFQPHLYSRTRDFLPAFARELSAADAVYLMHIYAARELSIPHVSAEHLYQQLVAPFKQLISLNQFPSVLAGQLSKPTVLLTLGAGDIDTVVSPTKQFLEANVSR